MNNKKLLSAYLPLAAAAALLGAGASSCASRRATVGVEPAVAVVSPDSLNRAVVDVRLRVPRSVLSRRSRLLLLPQLSDSTGPLWQYDPVAVDGTVYAKKLRRRAALEGASDPYTGRVETATRDGADYLLHYTDTLVLPRGEHHGARLTGHLTVDGCGTCEGEGSVLMAVVNDPVSLIEEKKELRLNWIEPEFVIRPKVREGRGVARLQFVINRYDIRPEMGRNRAELDTMLATLRPIVDDTLAELTSVSIYGMASADGSLAFNTPLARNRARSAARWLQEQLGLTPRQRSVFAIDSRPEGWEPVVKAMTAAGDADSAAVRDVLTRYADANDDVQERHIRRLPCWRRIAERYLQKDRNVEYVYTYRIRSFTTDAELLALYETRPDAFNEEELLRVSTLKTGPAEKEQVYRTILHYFPQSAVAANNLAVLMLRRGAADEAEQVLAAMENYTPEALNTLAATYIYRDDYERAVELLAAAADTLPQARYNLGLVRAKQRRLAEAWELLRPYDADLNTAIVALSTGRTAEAAAVMNRRTESAPRDEYVRALVAARRERADELFAHLGHAAADAALARRARIETDFMPYRADARWTALFPEDKNETTTRND